MRLQREKQRKRNTTIRLIGWAVSLLFLAFLMPSNTLAEESCGEGVEIEIVFQTIHRTGPQASQHQDGHEFLACRPTVLQSATDSNAFRQEAVWKSGNRKFINGCGAVLRL